MYDLKKLIDSIYSKNKVGHAFLFNVDDEYDTSVSLEFIKAILKKSVLNEEDFEKYSYQIDKNVFPDLVIVKSFDKVIKKEQILNIKSIMKEKSINSGKLFYIIEYAEYLNSSSANALLKFLEEPEDNIIAILVTKNINKVISTITSRCHIVNLNRYFRKKDEKYFDIAFNYLLIYENKKEKSIAYLSELYDVSLEELKSMINSWIYIYTNVLNLLIKNDIQSEMFNNYEKIVSQNNIESVLIKLDKLEKMFNLCFYNVNTRVILDELFI